MLRTAARARTRLLAGLSAVLALVIVAAAAVPAAAHRVASAPAPAYQPGDPGPGDPAGRARAALDLHVPPAWQGAVPVTLTVVGGNTSQAYTDGRIAVGRGQLDDTWDHARFIVVHEWAHQIAFRHGSGAHLGAPPAGFPYEGRHPEEVWADCAARALTGVSWPTYGRYPVCGADLAAWAGDWLAAGPR